jgi:hypothetical protein
MGYNTKLVMPVLLFNTRGDRVIIATCKRDEKKRERPKFLFASYCPFCGKKYPEEKCGCKNNVSAEEIQ